MDDAQGLAAKVAFLRCPGSYPEPTSRVEAIETHMSWLFLTDRFAYKLKKPIRRNGIDYSTPSMRGLNCRRELRLNRRLAAQAYLGVVALTVDGQGRLGLDGKGQRIDWLVRMQRLPAGQTLEHALRAGAVPEANARRIAGRLACFFASQPALGWSPGIYRRHLRAAVAEAGAQLSRPEYGLDVARIDRLRDALCAFIATRAGPLAARAARVIEGHGDLRPEHIYLGSPLLVIDCIEFQRGLRLHDPVDELAFLTMECERCGHAQFDAWLFAAYREFTADDPPRRLVDFYKAYNAFKRARIAIWHVDDPDTGPRAHWIASANDYLDRVGDYLSEAPTVGLAGRGVIDPSQDGAGKQGRAGKHFDP